MNGWLLVGYWLVTPRYARGGFNIGDENFIFGINIRNNEISINKRELKNCESYERQWELEDCPLVNT